MNDNPVKCNCQRHPDSAFTVRVKNDIPYCPRCGGICWPKIDHNALVPLDGQQITSIIMDCRQKKMSAGEVSDIICAKFGKDNSGMIQKERKVSLEEIKIIKSVLDYYNLTEDGFYTDVISEEIAKRLNATEERKGA